MNLRDEIFTGCNNLHENIAAFIPFNPYARGLDRPLTIPGSERNYPSGGGLDRHLPLPGSERNYPSGGGLDVKPAIPDYSTPSGGGLDRHIPLPGSEPVVGSFFNIVGFIFKSFMLLSLYQSNLNPTLVSILGTTAICAPLLYLLVIKKQ